MKRVYQQLRAGKAHASTAAPSEALRGAATRESTFVSALRDAAAPVARPLLGGLCCTLAFVMNCPGTAAQAAVTAALIARWRAGSLSSETLLNSIVAPFDSVRYFEFDFMHRSLKGRDRPRAYLDISSPRFLPMLVLNMYPGVPAELANPNRRDLQQTECLLSGLSHVRFSPRLISEFAGSPAAFDLITCLSVVEHIPGEDDVAALDVMWELLRPRGSLLLTVPCAKEAFEEYIDVDDYGLLEVDADGFTFGQRFYDENLLRKRFFRVAGEPQRFECFGERVPGYFVEDRARKHAGKRSRSWAESIRTARNYRRFGRPDEMPGIGVCAMEFVKR